MSDSPFPPNKSGHHPNSRANLRKPFGKGECHNPEGKNGRTRGEYVAAWLEKVDDTELVKKMIRKLGLPDGTTRIDALLQRDLVAGLGSSDQARKLLIEQFAGKAKIKVDLSSEDGSMSPMGPDSVVDSLRAAIEAKRTEGTEAPAQQGAPADDPASAK